MTLAVITSLIAFIAYGGLFSLVARSGLRSRLRWIFSLYVLVMFLLQATYLMVSLAVDEESALFWYTFNISLILGQALVYYFFIRTFMELGSSRKLVGASLVLWLLVVVVFVLFRSGFIPRVYRDSVTGLFVPEFGVSIVVLMLPAVAYMLATIHALLRGRRSGPYLQRVRLQYLLLAVLVVWVGMAANGIAVLRAYPLDVLANITSAVLIAFVILRYQLLDINLAIRKGMLYSVSVLMMGIGYFITIFLITRFFIWDQSSSLLLSFFAAVVVVGVLTPLRDRARARLDRALFREKYDGAAMIQRLSQTVASILNLTDLARLILNDIIATMHLQWACLLLERGGFFYPFAWQGLDGKSDLALAEDHPLLHWLAANQAIVTPETMRALLAHGILSRPQFDELACLDSHLLIPLKAGDKLVGILGLGPKLSQQDYSHDDEVILTTLANQVAIAIDNARLYAAVQRELVERISAEAEREDLIARLAAKNTELEGFTYTVSHDLKAPLVTIRGFLGLLEKDALAGDAARMRADMSRITEATDKMQRLLNELLELSRIGRLMNPPVSVPFNAIVQEAVELVHGRLTQRGVRVEVAPHMPVVNGDRLRLVQVAQNLVENAVKFMDAQPNPHIEIGHRGEEEGKPVFFVRDNGMGIAPEHQEKIFGIFNKLDPKAEGTGIGLSLVRRIVEVHGGRIWVESQPGQGATFFFTLPHSEVRA